MKSNTTFTIIIPCFKTNLDFFNECIESVLKQTYKNFECLIICSDNSVSAVNIPNDKRFKLLNCDVHSVGYKRNLGIQNAEGEYLIFLDCDDILEENYLILSNQIIVNDQNADIIYYCVTSDLNKLTSSNFAYVGETKEKIRELFIEKYLCSDDASLPKWVFSGNPAKVYRKNFIIKNNLKIKEDFGLVGEDKIFNLECAIAGPVIYHSNNCLYYYRVNAGSLYRANHNSNSLNWLNKYLFYSNEILSKEGYETKFTEKITWYYLFFWAPKYFRNPQTTKHISFRQRYRLVKNTLNKKEILYKTFKKHSLHNNYSKNKAQKFIFFFGVIFIKLRFRFSFTLLMSLYSRLTLRKSKKL